MLAANIIFALLWGVLLGPFTPANLVAGFAIGFVLIWIAGGARPGAARYVRRARALASLIGFTAVELVKSNLTVAWYTVSSLKKLRPGVLAIPLAPDSTDEEITLLANLITLTPGTLSLDVSEDRSALYVHFMNAENAGALVESIKSGFERRIREVTR